MFDKIMAGAKLNTSPLCVMVKNEQRDKLVCNNRRALFWKEYGFGIN